MNCIVSWTNSHIGYIQIHFISTIANMLLLDKSSPFKIDFMDDKYPMAEAIVGEFLYL